MMKGNDRNNKNMDSLICSLPQIFIDESGREIIVFSHHLYSDGNINTYFYDVE